MSDHTSSYGAADVSSKEEIEEEDEGCSICLEPFSSCDPSTATKCNHEYHLQCIIEWSQRSKECPVCWQLLVLKDPFSHQLLDSVMNETSNFRYITEQCTSLPEFSTIVNGESSTASYNVCPVKPSGPSSSSELFAFSESMKSKFSAASARCKASISNSTRGLKELSKEVNREMNASIAGFAKMIERLDLKSKRSSSCKGKVVLKNVESGRASNSRKFSYTGKE